MERRQKFRKNLNGIYLVYYESLCAILSEEWQPISGYRSFDEQAELYAQGRTTPGPVVTRAKAGFSMHCYGLATDWAYFEGGQYTPLEYNDGKWKEYWDACEKVGLRCLEWERPHNELDTKSRSVQLLTLYLKGGQKIVDEQIAREMDGNSDSAH